MIKENRIETIGENSIGKELLSSLVVIYREWESKLLVIKKSF